MRTLMEGNLEGERSCTTVGMFDDVKSGRNFQKMNDAQNRGVEDKYTGERER